jgi:hypothetical protein
MVIHPVYPPMIAKIYFDQVMSEINVYLKCLSLEGCKNMIVFTDDVTQQFWSYDLHGRTADTELTFLYKLYRKELPSDAKINHFYSNGGEELITESVKDVPTLQED